MVGETQKKRALRLDLLPEHYPYKDDGCEVSPSCLRCPLPKCKYDEPGWWQRFQREERDRDVLRAWREGLTVHQLAQKFGISPRTVFRILRAARHTGKAQGLPAEGGCGEG